jgi:hypothetical protein
MELKARILAVTPVTFNELKLAFNLGEDKNPIVGQNGGYIYTVFGLVLNARANSIGEWGLGNIPGFSGRGKDLLIRYNSGPKSKIESGQQYYLFVLEINNLLPNEELTIAVDGNELTLEPNRKTKVIVSGG